MLVQSRGRPARETIAARGASTALCFLDFRRRAVRRVTASNDPYLKALIGDVTVTVSPALTRVFIDSYVVCRQGGVCVAARASAEMPAPVSCCCRTRHTSPPPRRRWPALASASARPRTRTRTRCMRCCVRTACAQISFARTERGKLETLARESIIYY